MPNTLTKEQIAEIVAVAVRQEMARLSGGVVKSSETWRQYLVRQFTTLSVQSIAIFVLLVFQFGGTFRDASSSLAAAAEQAKRASVKADNVSAKVDAISQSLWQTQVDLKHATDRIIEQQATVAAFRADVNERTAAAVTRAEFRSAVVQQLIPRLDRIEQWMIYEKSEKRQQP